MRDYWICINDLPGVSFIFYLLSKIILPDKIGAADAWDQSMGAGVTIAVVDSGVDATHPDLSTRLVPGWNFFDNNSNTSDVYENQGHYFEAELPEEDKYVLKEFLKTH